MTTDDESRRFGSRWRCIYYFDQVNIMPRRNRLLLLLYWTWNSLILAWNRWLEPNTVRCSPNWKVGNLPPKSRSVGKLPRLLAVGKFADLPRQIRSRQAALKFSYFKIVKYAFRVFDRSYRTFCATLGVTILCDFVTLCDRPFPAYATVRCDSIFRVGHQPYNILRFKVTMTFEIWYQRPTNTVPLSKTRVQATGFERTLQLLPSNLSDKVAWWEQPCNHVAVYSAFMFEVYSGFVTNNVHINTIFVHCSRSICFRMHSLFQYHDGYDTHCRILLRLYRLEWHDTVKPSHSQSARAYHQKRIHLTSSF